VSGRLKFLWTVWAVPGKGFTAPGPRQEVQGERGCLLVAQAGNGLGAARALITRARKKRPGFGSLAKSHRST
jgi:hypothetical protein